MNMLRKITSIIVINNYDINQFDGYTLSLRHSKLIKTYSQH